MAMNRLKLCGTHNIVEFCQKKNQTNFLSWSMLIKQTNNLSKIRHRIVFCVIRQKLLSGRHEKMRGHADTVRGIFDGLRKF